MTAPANRGQVWTNYIKQPTPAAATQDQFWADLVKWIGSGKVVPVISGSLVYDTIFSGLVGDGGGEQPCAAPKVNASNALAMIWSNEIQYPLPDSMDMARVAQFVRSKSKSLSAARQAFIDFLKNFLLVYAGNGDAGKFPHLTGALDEYTFTELAVTQLGLVKFGPGSTDPISVLASLPLPVYVTTSYHDVIEQALEKFGKKPISQVCFWSGPQPPAPEYIPLTQFVPDPNTPLVYHLYGLEKYPLTLVLSEDDYMEFLMRITADQGKPDAVLPSYLINAIKLNQLLMLGFRTNDWDFRTLFRGIISARERQDKLFTNTIIQLSLADQYTMAGSDDVREALGQVQKYLEEYMNPLSFEIRWNDTGTFLAALREE